MEVKQHNKCQIGEKQLNSTVEFVITEYISLPPWLPLGVIHLFHTNIWTLGVTHLFHTNIWYVNLYFS